MLQLLGLKKAPTEFLIWKVGKFETTKGTFEMKDPESIIAAWKEYGNTLSFDYNHGVLDTGDRAKGAGTFVPEARGSELWATQIEWTPAARAGIEAGEWRYFSPLFEHDADGVVTELHNIALVNLPATKKMKPIAAKKGLGMTPEEKAKEAEALLAGLKAAQAALAIAKEACVKAGVEIEVEEEKKDEAPAPVVGTSRIEQAARAAYAGKSESEIVASIMAASLTADTDRADAVKRDVEQLISSGKVQPKRRAELIALRERDAESFAILARMLPTPAVSTVYQPALSETSLSADIEDAAFWAKKIGGFNASQFDASKKKVSR